MHNKIVNNTNEIDNGNKYERQIIVSQKKLGDFSL